MRKNIWRPFAEARAFVHTLNLKSGSQWKAYCKSGQKPADIPYEPRKVYEGEFVSMGNWLGTNVVADRLRVYRPFAEARAFVRTLGLQNEAEWYAYCKSGNKPDDIPAGVRNTYKKEFVSMDDWLNTDVVASSKRIFRPFEEARFYARSLGLKGYEAWKAYCKSGNKPKDIPFSPDKTYPSDFNGWGNWLGTGTIANFNRVYRSFAEARAFVHTLGLQNGEEWSAYCKSGNKPDDIPASPEQVYKADYVSAGDWLGTGRIANYYRIYRPFVEARAFTRTLGLRNGDEWKAYCKSGNKPVDIPANPHGSYGTLFTSMGDWLDTENIASSKYIFRPFAEARFFVRTLGLKTLAEWNAYCKSGKRPIDIPTNPHRFYHAEFRGLSDWLGMAPRRWNKTALRTLLEDLRPYIHFLQERELYMLLQHTGALPALRFALNKVSPFELIQVLRLQYPDLVQTLDTFPENGIEELSVAPDTSLPQTANLALSLMAKPQSVFLQAYPESSKHYHIDEDMSGRQVNMLSAYLHAIDHLTDQFDLDEEMAMYLIDNRVSALWERYSNEGEEVLCKLLAEDGGRFFQEVKQRFLAEIAAVERLPIPSGWSFTDEQGRLAFPNHMQRYIAWAVREKRRQGNWSGTGAGKTLAAILSTRVCQAHVTLVVMNIATIENWRTQILQAYPNSIIHLDVPPASLLDRQGFHYILLNYEQFQTTGRQHLVERLLACRLDEIVLDEVQFVKQRGQKESSRRKSITALLTGAERDNPALCVLVMSATPVINNLVEGKTLVELLLGKSLPELGTIPTVDNALALHRALLRSGFRYQPRSQQELATHILPITCNDLLEHLQVIEWSTLAMETVQLPYKLETIRSFIQPGTVFYTYFIAEGRMIDTICAFIKRLGLTVGRYTGTDKSGLELFLGGQVDVLVGSKPLGTGLNGLQTRANRLIILSLPWTSAEYDQLLGRLWRQGSRFQAVEIFIPQVILEVAGESWSYDRARLAVIQEKRTLSDCVIDGRIPASVRVTERALLQQSRAALEQWIARINKVSV